jgi:hypothetical protein
MLSISCTDCSLVWQKHNLILYPLAAPRQLQYLRSVLDLFNIGKPKEFMEMEQMRRPSTYYGRSKGRCNEFDERCW